MSTMTQSEVETKHITGRREVHYNQVDDIVADAQRLLESGYTRLGNWNLGTMAGHISKAFQTGLDGSPFKVNFLIRFVARTLYKDKAMRKMSPGFKLPKQAASLLAQIDEDRQGVEELRGVIERWKNETQRHPHGFFGELTPDEWNTLMLRHAEMHMSFLVPKA